MIISPHMEEEIRRMALARKSTNADIIAILLLYYCLFPSRRWSRLSLTCVYMRRNNTYIQFARKMHGQTQKARSKTAGTQTHRHPQPSPRRRFRHFVPGESVLRLQTPASSALRDAPAPPRRRRSCRRGLLAIRNLSPHLLSGPNRIRKWWPDGLAAQAAGPKATAQAVRRNSRVRPELEDFLSWLDYRRVHQDCRESIRHHRSSPQPGTGDGRQKKTPQVELRLPLSAGATEAYEALRQRVIQPGRRHEPAERRGGLHRWGLARWAQVQLCSTTERLPPGSHPRSAGSQLDVPPAWVMERVKGVARPIISFPTPGIPCR